MDSKEENMQHSQHAGGSGNTNAPPYEGQQHQQQQQGPPQGQYQQGPPQGQYQQGPPQGQYQQGPPQGGQFFQQLQQGITMQPMVNMQPQLVWAPRPPPLMGYPPGLEFLGEIDRLMISEEVNLMGGSAGSKYIIKDASERLVFRGQEDVLSPYRQGSQGHRGFSIGILDSAGQEVMRLVKPYKGCAGVNCCACSDGCAMELLVECPPDNELGRIKQECSCMGTNYNVLDKNGTAQLYIQGFSSFQNAHSDIEFQLLTADKANHVGKIVKLYSGGFQEMFTTADNFILHFPSDLDVTVKALMIGGTILVDFHYFQGVPPAQRAQRRRRR